MEMQTIQYREGKGWSEQGFPNLDSENTLVVVFASPDFKNNPQPLKELAKHYSKSHIVGCSSSGEISGDSILDKSLSVAIIRFKDTKIKSAQVNIKDSAESLNVGKQIAEALKGDQIRGVFVLSEGLNVNGSELAKGLNSAFNKDVVVTGGLAGDGSDFKHTWSIHNGKIYENTIVAVGFYGNSIRISHASRGGWDIFGPERRITHSKNNILYELDGKPALSLYKEYLGDRAQGLPATGLLFPLAIRKDKNDPGQLVRTILAVDEKTQSLTFAGDVPTGYLAQLMRANFDRLISSAGEAGETLGDNIIDKKQTKPVLCLAVSCVGRRLLLGERTEEETEAVIKSLPNGSKMIGFYSYGELSPYTTGECSLHNQTMTLTALRED